MPVRCLPMGPAAVLVERLPATPAAWGLGLREMALPGVVDVVPAAETVLVRCTDGASMREVAARFGDVVAITSTAADREVTIDVRYDGADLDHVAEACGLSAEAVVALHCDATYTVAFCGFAPGFGYLAGLPAPLRLPRRSTPRQRVPAGSVAIAADYSAVYPRMSPGGWHLLGTTDAVLFDPAADPPSLFAPGVTVRFRAAR